MSLINRIGQLFSADCHGLLDSLEEPETMLKQAIREMREEIEKGEAQINGMDRQQQKWEAGRDSLFERQKELEKEIDLCFAHTNETLAKSLIRTKLEARRRIQALETQLEELAKEKDACQSNIDKQKQKLHAVVEKQQLFSETEPAQQEYSHDPEGSFVNGIRISDEDVEVAFLKAKQQFAPEQPSP